MTTWIGGAVCRVADITLHVSRETVMLIRKILVNEVLLE